MYVLARGRSHIFCMLHPKLHLVVSDFADFAAVLSGLAIKCRGPIAESHPLVPYVLSRSVAQPLHRFVLIESNLFCFLIPLYNIRGQFSG